MRTSRPVLSAICNFTAAAFARIPRSEDDETLREASSAAIVLPTSSVAPVIKHRRIRCAEEHCSGNDADRSPIAPLGNIPMPYGIYVPHTKELTRE